MTKILISQELKDYYGHLTDIQIEEFIKMQDAQDEQEQAQIDAWDKYIDELHLYEEIPFTPIVKKEVSIQEKDETLTIKTLTFGMNIGSTGKVSYQDWEEFKASQITPRFPGYTEREVKGYWEGEPEDSIELVIACPDSPKYEHKLEEIREAYCKRFQQGSVMKTNADNTVKF